MDNDRKMYRREFIRDVSLAGLGLAVGPALLDLSARKSSAQAGMSKIVIANHPKAVKGMRVNAEIAQRLVDMSVMQLTGQSSIADAWASILPSLSPDDLVTIKVNCINRSLTASPPGRKRSPAANRGKAAVPIIYPRFWIGWNPVCGPMAKSCSGRWRS